jgi:protein-tyrosine phosphatase
MKRLRRALLSLAISTSLTGLSIAFAAESAPVTALTGSNAYVRALTSTKTPSEDALIPNLHSLGVIDGRTNIYRCGSPTMSVAREMKSWPPSPEDQQAARERMQRLYDLGVRTVISFQHQVPPKTGDTNRECWAVALEKSAAEQVGLAYEAFPMSNKGAHSFEDMSDAEVQQLMATVSAAILKAARTGGVAFHCQAGKDRAGLVAGYLRIKYQGWPAEKAIAEMRRYGHVWYKFSKPGEQYSWHEEHLLAISKMPSVTPQP